MEDAQIIAMYLRRDEQAIEQTDRKYGKALTGMAKRILSNEEDSHECVNDTYLKAWNSIPPIKPTNLSSYLYRIIRSVSIDRYRARKSDKRRASEYAASLDELGECIAGKETPHDAMELELLLRTIRDYLSLLPKRQRQMFICRYYFLDPIKKIAEFFHISEAKAKSSLYRIRCGLKTYLEQEGFFI